MFVRNVEFLNLYDMLRLKQYANYKLGYDWSVAVPQRLLKF